jgi:hypothetical protein
MNQENSSAFKRYSNNVTSQYGEDGVISEIFKRIKSKSKICVEFGAWDGIHCSNTWDLWHNNGWDAILIEADENKYQELLTNTRDFSKVNVLNKFVSPNGHDSLDSILQHLNIAKDFDLLSIDIDGDDYYILKSLNYFCPKLIVIEYNPTIPPQISIIQNKGEYFGSSARAIYELAKSKGYHLVHLSDTNVFLVHKDYFHLLKIKEQNLNEIFPDKYINYIFSSYDGDLFVSNNFVYGIKKNIKEILSFRNVKIVKTFFLNKIPFTPVSKTQKILIIDQINQNE